MALLPLGACGPLSDAPDEPSTQETPEQPGDDLLVSVLDIGQGLCVALITADGEAMLIDGGRSQQRMEEIVVPYLEARGVSRIDYLVLTHPDQDHVGGMPRLLELMDVSAYVDPVIPNTNQTYEEVLTMVQDSGIEPIRGRRGMELDLGSEVTASILWPPEELLMSGGEAEKNDNSIVLRVEYGDTVILIPGDAEEGAEMELVELEDDQELRSDVLVVGHHGSNSSSRPAFLDAVSPEFAVISAGFDNQYGHPHDEVVQRLRMRDIEIFRTDLDGTVEVTTDGESITVDALGTEATP